MKYKKETGEENDVKLRMVTTNEKLPSLIAFI